MITQGIYITDVQYFNIFVQTIISTKDSTKKFKKNGWEAKYNEVYLCKPVEKSDNVRQIRHIYLGRVRRQ